MEELIQISKKEKERLSNELRELKRQVATLKDGLGYYAEIKCKWDKGVKARRAFKNSSNPNYKPVFSVVAQIFRDSPPLLLGPCDQMEGFEDYISGDTDLPDS